MPMQVQYEYGTTKVGYIIMIDKCLKRYKIIIKIIFLLLQDVVQKLKDIGHTVIRLRDNGGSGGSAASAIARSPSGMIEAMPDFRRKGNSSGY